MDCIALILEKLRLRGIVAAVNEYDINWIDDSGVEHYVQLKNMDCSGSNLAWFQSTEEDQYVLRVYQNHTAFSWEPISHNLYFGCSCNLLEWYKDHLIFSYTEKHDTYICSMRDEQVSTFNFHGNRMERKENIIFFQEHEDESKLVRRMLIPELEEIDPITEQEAQAQGVLPQLLLFSNDLKNK